MIQEIKFGKYLIKNIPHNKVDELEEVIKWMDTYETYTVDFMEWVLRDWNRVYKRQIK